jgi:2-polyprenyl-3-methyl-5-hydroxy-6-metoxy-1,4-benzoquinol methylase
VTFDRDYFSNRRYRDKEELVGRHVLSVLGWASEATGTDLLDGHGKTVLDVGCAYGYTSHALAELGYEAFGTDISGWGIKQAKQLTNSEFLVCDAQTSLPFKAETFDLETCFDVLEHLPNPQQALLGMFEASRGILVCTTPNRKVEKPIRKLMRDYDETHISTKSQADWQKCVSSTLSSSQLRLDAFYDFALRFGKRLFYKSVNIPTYGLTVRIAVKK